MHSAIFRFCLLASISCIAYSQPVDKSLTFEAASVKPAEPPKPDAQGRILMAGPSGGPGTRDPGRIRYPFMNLRNLLMNAYDVKSFQINGPAWLDTERYEINATMAPNITKEQFRVMLQNLLAERFKLTLHRETKELPMYSLIVTKAGPKFKESAEAPPPKEGDSDSPPPLPVQPKMGPDGFPVLSSLPRGGRGGMIMMMMPGRARLSGQNQSVQDLADRLSQQLTRPVVDSTGLKGKYDITLTFSTEGLPGPAGPMGPLPMAPPGGGPGGPGPGGPGPNGVFVPEGEAPPDIFTALQSQLGLKLEPKKGPVDTIVIDHAEKTPTEN
jgi:uncharacterized protein (TIGR03435 family)